MEIKEENGCLGTHNECTVYCTNSITNVLYLQSNQFMDSRDCDC